MKGIKTRFCSRSYFLLALSFFIGLIFLSLGQTKELPLLVKLSEISQAHDGKRITVFGQVQSAKVKTGRRGSLHLELIIGEGEHTVHVYTIRPISNILGQAVIVQGIYHEEGRFAGHYLERFITAESILKDGSKALKTQ